MRAITYLLLISLFLNCNKLSPSSPSPLKGKWELTEYNKDGANISDENLFTCTTINVTQRSSLSSELYISRYNDPCDHLYPIIAYTGENNISFYGNCDTLNKTDPLFYNSRDTANNGISGIWEFEHMDNLMFIINNSNNHSRKNDLRVVFEKKK